MKKTNDLLNIILPIITLLALLVFWQVASVIIGSEYILPSLSQTAVALFNLFKSGEFYIALSFTLIRSLIAFALSFVVAFFLAFAVYKRPLVAKIVNPIISVIRALPTIAVILLLLFWTNSKVAPIIVTMLVVLPTAYTNLSNAFEEIEKGAVEASRVDGANEKQVFSFIVFPLIAPAFYKAVGSGISLNFKLMVAAEVLAQTAKSLGYLLNTSKVYFEIAQMMALVLVSVVFGVIFEQIFNRISFKAGGWR